MNIVDVIRALAGFAWLAAIGLVVLALVRTGRNQNSKGIGSTAIVVLIVAAILSTLGAGLVYVESTERGVVRTIRAGGRAFRSAGAWPTLDRSGCRAGGHLLDLQPELHYVRCA